MIIFNCKPCPHELANVFLSSIHIRCNGGEYIATKYKKFHEKTSDLKSPFAMRFA